MKIRSILTTILLLISSSGFSQVVIPERGYEKPLDRHVIGLGFFAGPATGLGLSVRHHLPSPFSYQVTGGVIKTETRLSYDIGVEGQWDLARGATTRVFVAGGYAFYYSGTSRKNNMRAPHRVGLGIGAELGVSSGFHSIGELMFVYFSDETILPLPQIGIHYYF